MDEKTLEQYLRLQRDITAAARALEDAEIRMDQFIAQFGDEEVSEEEVERVLNEL